MRRARVGLEGLLNYVIGEAKWVVFFIFISRPILRKDIK